MYNLKQYNIHLPHSLQQTSTVTTMSQNMRTTITSYSISSTKLQKLTISVADFASTAVVLFTMVFFLFLTTIISIFNYKQLLQVESTDRAGHRCRQILHWSLTLPLAGVSGYAWALCSRCSWIVNISTKKYPIYFNYDTTTVHFFSSISFHVLDAIFSFSSWHLCSRATRSSLVQDPFCDAVLHFSVLLFPVELAHSRLLGDQVKPRYVTDNRNDQHTYQQVSRGELRSMTWF